VGIGKAIRMCRIQRELSQQELANKAGISIAYLSLIERNKRDPVLSTVESIASALSVPLVALVFLAADETNQGQLGNELCEKLSYVAFH